MPVKRKLRMTGVQEAVSGREFTFRIISGQENLSQRDKQVKSSKHGLRRDEVCAQQIIWIFLGFGWRRLELTARADCTV